LLEVGGEAVPIQGIPQVAYAGQGGAGGHVLRSTPS
jgi:hypothetical protein